MEWKIENLGITFYRKQQANLNTAKVKSKGK